jgi:acetyl-CoA C-acetyltransferase
MWPVKNIVILSATRTPLGAFQGKLSSFSAPQLGAVVISSAVSQAGIPREDATDVVMGNVLQAGVGQAPARQAAVGGGLLPSTRCSTIHKVCGSGLEAVIQGARSLAVGHSKCVVAGGMESMSSAPYLLPKARSGYRLGHQSVIDSVIHDGLWDPCHNMHMGACAEECAKKYRLSREEQDTFAIESFRRATATQTSGGFEQEITPLQSADKKDGALINHDEGPGKVIYEKIPKLRPSFDQEGTITPANASSLNDGAAALVLTTGQYAGERGLKPIARIVSFGAHSHEPLWFTTAPISAARNALSAAGWGVNDVDLWEINEAFAVVALAFMKELDIPHERTNVRGGAIALGHPIGASGARIIVTLIAAMRERQAKRGLAAICIGGGEGLATCIEIL